MFLFFSLIYQSGNQIPVLRFGVRTKLLSAGSGCLECYPVDLDLLIDIEIIVNQMVLYVSNLNLIVMYGWLDR